MQSRASFGHSCTLTGWVLTENTALRSFWERKMPLFVFGKGEGAVFRLRLPSFHVALPVKTQVWLVAFPPSLSAGTAAACSVMSVAGADTAAFLLWSLMRVTAAGTLGIPFVTASQPRSPRPGMKTSGSEFHPDRQQSSPTVRFPPD